MRRVRLLLLAPALLTLAACGSSGVSEEAVRQIVQEESAAQTESVRRIAREEIAQALAARDESSTDCTAATAAARALPSVVKIEVPSPATTLPRSTGSGFVALAGGIIVTAAHVVDDARRVEVVTADGRRIAGDVIRRDPVLDLAVVRAADRALPALKWADPAALALGEPVRIAGFPGSGGLTVTGGVLASRSASPPEPRELLVTDADADLGNSGGPLLTQCGEALGVVVERRPFVTTVSTISVGAGTALPFIVAAAGAAPAVASPAASPSPRPTRSP